MAYPEPLPDEASTGEAGHTEDHNQIVSSVRAIDTRLNAAWGDIVGLGALASGHTATLGQHATRLDDIELDLSTIESGGIAIGPTPPSSPAVDTLWIDSDALVDSDDFSGVPGPQGPAGGFTMPGPWVAGSSYAVGTVVEKDGGYFRLTAPEPNNGLAPNPRVVASGTIDSVYPAASVTIPSPVGMAAGDKLIVFIESQSTNAAATGITFPAFAELGASINVVNLESFTKSALFACVWRDIGLIGAEPTYVINMTNPSAVGEIRVTWVLLRGVNAGAPTRTQGQPSLYTPGGSDTIYITDLRSNGITPNIAANGFLLAAHARWYTDPVLESDDLFAGSAKMYSVGSQRRLTSRTSMNVVAQRSAPLSTANPAVLTVNTPIAPVVNHAIWVRVEATGTEPYFNPTVWRALPGFEYYGPQVDITYPRYNGRIISALRGTRQLCDLRVPANRIDLTRGVFFSLGLENGLYEGDWAEVEVITTTDNYLAFAQTTPGAVGGIKNWPVDQRVSMAGGERSIFRFRWSSEENFWRVVPAPMRAGTLPREYRRVATSTNLFKRLPQPPIWLTSEAEAGSNEESVAAVIDAISVLDPAIQTRLAAMKSEFFICNDTIMERPMNTYTDHPGGITGIAEGKLLTVSREYTGAAGSGNRGYVTLHEIGHFIHTSFYTDFDGELTHNGLTGPRTNLQLHPAYIQLHNRTQSGVMAERYKATTPVGGTIGSGEDPRAEWFAEYLAYCWLNLLSVNSAAPSYMNNIKSYLGNVPGDPTFWDDMMAFMVATGIPGVRS